MKMYSPPTKSKTNNFKNSKKRVEATVTSPKTMTANVNDVQVFPSLSNKVCETKSNISYSKIKSQKKESETTSSNELKKEELKIKHHTKFPKHWTVVSSGVKYRPENKDIIEKKIIEERAKNIIESMKKRWQKERDDLNDLLGDLSPYWDAPLIGEEDPESDEENDINSNN